MPSLELKAQRGLWPVVAATACDCFRQGNGYRKRPLLSDWAFIEHHDLQFACLAGMNVVEVGSFRVFLARRLGIVSATGAFLPSNRSLGLPISVTKV